MKYRDVVEFITVFVWIWLFIYIMWAVKHLTFSIEAIAFYIATLMLIDGITTYIGIKLVMKILPVPTEATNIEYNPLGQFLMERFGVSKFLLIHILVVIGIALSLIIAYHLGLLGPFEDIVLLTYIISGMYLIIGYTNVYPVVRGVIRLQLKTISKREKYGGK